MSTSFSGSGYIVSLPVEIRCIGKVEKGSCSCDHRKILESIGITFDPKKPKTPCGQAEFVELPIGWKFVQTEAVSTYMLIDQHKRDRALVRRYRIASYMELLTKFGIKTSCVDSRPKLIGVAEVFSAGELIESFSYEGDIKASGIAHSRLDIQEDVKSLAMEWLDQNFPDWKNPGAYWD